MFKYILKPYRKGVGAGEIGFDQGQQTEYSVIPLHLITNIRRWGLKIFRSRVKLVLKTVKSETAFNNSRDPV